ncbi:MAG TPA: hypothetical protein VLT45_09115 [Kofleriaceae bacterium]|nr:hypothetical protein [Kofleriaceae bacterium]
MGDLGFGTDLRGASDLFDTMDEITDPNDPLIVAEAIARRLDCPAGGLIDDPLYGKDLREYLNRGTTDAELMRTAAEIRAEVMKDDRVDQAVVTVTPGGLPLGSRLEISIRITPVDPRTGVFTMTLQVTSAAVVLEAMNQ